MDSAASLSDSTDTPAEGGGGRVLTERLLDSFTSAVTVSGFDDRLFDVSSGGDLGQRLTALADAVRAADVESMMRRQGFVHSLTGADVEARIRFALARQAAQAALAALETAARTTAERLSMLQASCATVQADDARLASVAAKAQALQREFALPATAEDRELRARFERRLSNLEALRASNSLTLAQLPVAIAHFKSLLDRFIDVKMTLFPVWERHALAVVQAPQDGEALAALRAAATALAGRIVKRMDIAA